MLVPVGCKISPRPAVSPSFYHMRSKPFKIAEIHARTIGCIFFRWLDQEEKTLHTGCDCGLLPSPVSRLPNVLPETLGGLGGLARSTDTDSTGGNARAACAKMKNATIDL